MEQTQFFPDLCILEVSARTPPSSSAAAVPSTCGKPLIWGRIC